MLCGDPLRVRQVLNNLIANAIKFTNQGRISVRVNMLSESPAGAILRFEVADTGIGISAESQALLFKPFSQDSSISTRYGGCGLGLAIARQLVERMKRTIGVSSAPGRGSTFWFTVWLATAPTAVFRQQLASGASPAPTGPEVASALINGEGHPLHLLLAEDNASNRKVALWQLEKLGCKADIAVNGIEAVEASAKTSYDAILMDCRMPQMDGYEATRRIRQREGSAKHTAIVAMTAHALAGDREKCLAAGMDDYVSKPVTLEELAATLRRVTSQAASAASAAPGAQGEPAAPQASALDESTMASLRAERDLLPNLISTALDGIPEDLKKIAEAFNAHHYPDAAIAAHSLKGTARIFGAERMAKLAAALEQLADSEPTGWPQAEFDQLTQECGRVSRELEQERVRIAAAP